MDKALPCDACDKWFHIKCVDISVEIYEVVKKFDGGKLGTMLNWYCPKCSGVVNTVLMDMKGIAERQSRLEKDIVGIRVCLDKHNGFESELKILTKRIIQIEKDSATKAELEEMRKIGDEFSKVRDEVKSFAEIVKSEEKVSKESGAGHTDGNRATVRNLQVEVVEALEREKRRKNLVIMEIPEDEAAGDLRGVNAVGKLV